MKSNKQNDRIWAQENPHLQNITKTQYPMKINVWAGIFGSHIIGPYFLEETLTGAKYLELLQEKIGPELVQKAGNNERPIFYQHDGCPAHNAACVREYLDSTFPNTWIGNSGPIHWPARSPDLSPLDFYLWGKLKNNLYGLNKEYLDREDLKRAICEECRKITAMELSNVRNEFYNRVNYCLIQNGSHFEYIT